MALVGPDTRDVKNLFQHFKLAFQVPRSMHLCVRGHRCYVGQKEHESWSYMYIQEVENRPRPVWQREQTEAGVNHSMKVLCLAVELTVV